MLIEFVSLVISITSDSTSITCILHQANNNTPMLSRQVVYIRLMARICLVAGKQTLPTSKAVDAPMRTEIHLLQFLDENVIFL